MHYEYPVAGSLKFKKWMNSFLIVSIFNNFVVLSVIFCLEFSQINHLNDQDMKNNRAIYRVFFAVLLMLLLLNCKKQATLPQTTLPILPVVKTGTATETGSDYAILTGETIADGGAAITDAGFCWSTDQNPNITCSHINAGKGICAYQGTISGLSPGTSYYVRAYATNSAGTAYGNQLSITTKARPATLTVTMVEREETYATFDVSVHPAANSTVTARGICWGTKPLPTINDNKTTDGSGAGNFTSRVNGLDPSTDYFFRAYATIGDSTIYAIYYNGYLFELYPRVYTSVVSALTPTTAIVWGGFDTDWKHPVNIRGICWSTTPSPTITDNHTAEWVPTIGYNGFKCSLSGLSSNTTYYLRAYAIGIAGPHYGDQISFATEKLSGPVISDIDGNIYHTVTIGTQVWMAEDLKTTRYRNGDLIPNVTDGNEWIKLMSGAWCNYDDPLTSQIFDYSIFNGKFYNWYAVNDSRNIAPSGWHVPGDAEWTTLINYLKNNGSQDVSKSMAARSHWRSLNRELTDLASNNSSGFTALPAGRRVTHDFIVDGSGTKIWWTSDLFFGIGSSANWWSSSDLNGNVSSLYLSLSSGIYSASPSLVTNTYKMDGFSVRCVKD